MSAAQGPPLPYVEPYGGALRVVLVHVAPAGTWSNAAIIHIDGRGYVTTWQRRRDGASQAFQVPAERPVHVAVTYAASGLTSAASAVLPPGTETLSLVPDRGGDWQITAL